MKSAIYLTLTGLMVVSSPAIAQVADTAEIAQKIRDMGTTLSREVVGGTHEIYAPLYPAMPIEGVELVSDQAYGEADRNLLDIYKPADADGSAPVVIFAHGGGFVRGDKAEVANLGPWFAQNGVVFLAMNYRLAPEAKWPSGPEDMAAAVSWVRDNAEVHGGDPQKIIVAGNSAGSAHAADYAFREDMQFEDDGVIGAILISPPTANLADHEIDPERDAQYYDTAAGSLEDMSYIRQLDGRALPVMVAVGELDIPLAQDQAGQLINALYARDGHLPTTSVVPGHNHISIIAHIGTEDASLGPDMLEFIRYAALFPTQ